MSARGQSAFLITLVARPLLAKIWGRARGFVTLPNNTRWIESEHPWRRKPAGHGPRPLSLIFLCTELEAERASIVGRAVIHGSSRS